MKLLLVLNLLILTVNIQAWTITYPDRLSDGCHLEEISEKDIIRKLQHATHLESHMRKWDLMCFSYKIGLVNDYGEINERFLKELLTKAADELLFICANDNEDVLETQHHKYMLCLKRNIPYSLSLL